MRTSRMIHAKAKNQTLAEYRRQVILAVPFSFSALFDYYLFANPESAGYGIVCWQLLQGLVAILNA